MAASTITRVTWTDGSSGTVINNAVKNSDIYDPIDEMFAGGGSYATFTFGGKVAIEGTGTVMNLSGGVAGAQEIAIRNTSAGATNYAAVKLGNDGAANVGFLAHTSSSFTATGSQPQDGLSLRNSRAGGISIAAEHASGIIALYAGGTTERARVTAAGMLLVGDTANANMTIGLTLNQGASDDEIFALKSSDVAHGATAVTETDTFARFLKAAGDNGGLTIEGLRDNSANASLQLAGSGAGNADTTRATGSDAAVNIIGRQISGTGYADMVADGNVLTVKARRVGADQTILIVDEDGDLHLDATSTNNVWDDHDDVGLLENFRVLTMTAPTFKRHFAHHMKQHAQVLANTGVLTLNKDGHHFYSTKALNGLIIDAIRQVYARMMAHEQRLVTLEGR